MTSSTQLVLLSSKKSIESASDIRAYLRSGFAYIYRQHLHIMKHVAWPWPSWHVMDILCERSSGQFIYAATILRFVGGKASHPLTQLEIVVQATPRDVPLTKISELDRLYLQVLSTHLKSTELVDILGYSMVVGEPHLAILDDLLDFEPGTAVTSLTSLHSLLRIPGMDHYTGSTISFYDSSFHDFLLRAELSGDFYVDLERYRVEVLKSCVNLIVRCLDEASR